jgi:hypothetical protein
MKEKKLQANILRAINKIPGVTAFAHVATEYTPTGHPDIYGVFEGKSFFAEVKLPGKEPTEIQHAMLRKLRECGAYVYIWTSVEEAEYSLSLIKIERRKNATFRTD